MPTGSGRLLLSAGVGLILAGLAVSAAGRAGLGRLPGDLFLSRGGFHVYAPLATSLVVSVALTVLVNVLRRH
ncbi:MAG TPA: DUF2905 domain-containing protein [Acidimicrobiales bacterium]|nr:DUF2905 domain-containing protein [Acidimicrobiales bacterium]